MFPVTHLSIPCAWNALPWDIFFVRGKKKPKYIYFEIMLHLHKSCSHQMFSRFDPLLHSYLSSNVTFSQNPFLTALSKITPCASLCPLTLFYSITRISIWHYPMDICMDMDIGMYICVCVCCHLPQLEQKEFQEDRCFVLFIFKLGDSGTVPGI